MQFDEYIILCNISGSTDSASHGSSTTAELLVSTDLYISIAWGLSKWWSENGLEVTDPLFTFMSIWSAVRPCS